MQTSLKDRQIQHIESIQGRRKQKSLQEILSLKCVKKIKPLCTSWNPYINFIHELKISEVIQKIAVFKYDTPCGFVAIRHYGLTGFDFMLGTKKKRSIELMKNLLNNISLSWRFKTLPKSLTL